MFTYRQNSRPLWDIKVGEHDGDVIFLTGSSNKADLRMRNEKYVIWPIFMAESPKFLHLIGSRGREHDDDARFLTGSRIIGVSRMRNEKYAIWPVFMAESPTFLHHIGNRRRRTRW